MLDQIMELLDGPAVLRPIDDIALRWQAGQVENADRRGNILQRLADRLDVLATGCIVVRQNHNSRAAQKLRMLGAPFLGAAHAARRWHIPRAQKINLGLALDNQHEITILDRLFEFGQLVGHHRHALGIPNPFTGPIGIGALLAVCFLALAVLGQDERAVRVLKFDPLDDEHEDASRIVIFELRRGDLAWFARAVLAVRLLWRRLAVDCFTGAEELAAIDMLHEGNHVAALATAAAVPDLLCDIDGESIFPAAFRTRANQFLTFTLERESAAPRFIFEPRALATAAAPSAATTATNRLIPASSP
jgi:hypothetical protein